METCSEKRKGRDPKKHWWPYLGEREIKRSREGGKGERERGELEDGGLDVINIHVSI
jgi:hypothetical protein